MPKQFSEEELRGGIIYYIWTPTVSDAARRCYVAEHLWFSLAGLCLSGIAWLSDRLIFAAVFGAMALMATAYIAWQSYRYWVRGPNFSS
jgi:hypothetical protein